MADAAHAKPHHDYHLVNPSPWPAVGATAAFVMALGLILWMHNSVPYASLTGTEMDFDVASFSAHCRVPLAAV